MRQAGFVMHKAGQRGMAVFNSNLADLGFDVRQYGVLSVLAEGSCSQVALSEAVRVDRTSIVQLIDELEAKGLVKRTVNRTDRRAHLVKITRKGRAAVLAADARAQDADAEFLQPLTSREKGNLLLLLKKLV